MTRSSTRPIGLSFSGHSNSHMACKLMRLKVVAGEHYKVGKYVTVYGLHGSVKPH